MFQSQKEVVSRHTVERGGGGGGGRRMRVAEFVVWKKLVFFEMFRTH